MKKPEVWAVVVGINKYENGIPPCTGAVADARAIRDWLFKHAGWDSRHLLVMDDGAAPGHGPATDDLEHLRPTKANLDWALREYIPARARPGDVVVVYFAGQAVSLPQPRDAKPSDPPGHLLVPSDAKRGDLFATCWSLETSLDPLAAKGQNPILLWLDTSLYGRGKRVVEHPEDGPNTERWLQSLARWPNVSAWVAADEKPALEGATTRERSPFAAGLLAALGTREKPLSLLACLDELNRDPRLNRQGFRTLGGVSPELTLSSTALAALAEPPRELLAQDGHAAQVTALAISSDGLRLFSASADSTLKVWRTRDRMLMRSFPNHFIGVTALAQSPDGSLLATGDGDGRIWLWRLADVSGKTHRAARPHAQRISEIAFLADSKRFVSRDRDGRIVLWNAREDALDSAIVLEKGAGGVAALSDGFVAAVKSDNTTTLRIFTSDGEPARDVPGPGGLVAQGLVVSSGHYFAAADRAGELIVYDDRQLERPVYRGAAKGRVAALALNASAVVAGVGSSVRIHSLKEPNVATLATNSPVSSLVLSPDGNRLSALTEAGDALAWSLDGPNGPREIANVAATAEKRAVSAVFAPNGGQLIVGDADGGIRAFEIGKSEPAWRIAARRGKIDGLALSRDGQALLQITHDWTARIWELRAGRSLERIDGGQWTAGAFLPDGQTLALTNRDGDVVLVERRGSKRKAAQFKRPTVENGGDPSHWTFGIVSISPNGKRIAAGTPRGELVAVWDISGGEPTRVIRAHKGWITAVSFSDDRHLLTAGREGVAFVWDLDDPTLRDRPQFSLRGDSQEPGAINAISAAHVAQNNPRKIAAGYQDGRLVLWSINEAGTIKTDLLPGRFDGEIRSVAFTPDGAHLIAAGMDKVVRLWKLEDKVGAPERLTPQHTESVNAIVAWPDSKIFASAGEDSIVRFWSLERPFHLGTLSASYETGDWVAFSPDGQFDSSPGGETRITWLVRDEVLPLEQFYERSRFFGLTDLFRQGIHPEPRLALLDRKPAGLAIDPPASPTLKSRDAKLTIRLADARIQGLRLYQNGVPVLDEADLARVDERTVQAPVVLRPGANEFYAMAPSPDGDAADARSNAVRINGEIADAPTIGRLHVLAVGVSEYEKRPLKFADRDANSVADFLHLHGPGEKPRPGLRRLITNSQVKRESVLDALSQIRAELQPEDSIVVFLAGHADVRRDSFCYLLPGFPFQKETTPAPIEIASRGSRGSGGAAEPADPSTMLPYALIYNIVARLPALNRLVVIDACQGDALFNDPMVRRIQDKVDDGAHRARTAYLLAARDAQESEKLKHGVFTHVLLRGLGAPDLEREPGEPLPPNANRDKNDEITTEEVRRYIADNLPILAARLAPGNAVRAGDNNRGASEAARIPVFEAVSDRPFPLVRVRP